MLIVLVGLPKSGKSTFIDFMLEHITRPHLVRPSDWHPDEADKSGNWQIAAWEYALEKATSLLAHTGADDMVILDTCGASPKSLDTLIAAAKLYNHQITTIFIATPRTVCESRIEPYIIQKYITKIRDAVLTYKTISDKLIIVRHGGLKQWQHQAALIAQKLQNASSAPPPSPKVQPSRRL